MVKPIPEGARSVTPHLVVRDAAAALDFYARAFGAREMFRVPAPNGLLMHAQMMIGDSVIFLADEFPGMGSASPLGLAGSPVTIHLFVEDCDATFASAVAAGATVTMPLMDMFWGDRYGRLRDPFGHEWAVATHKEDVPPEEFPSRAAAAFSQKDCGGGG